MHSTVRQRYNQGDQDVHKMLAEFADLAELGRSGTNLAVCQILSLLMFLFRKAELRIPLILSTLCQNSWKLEKSLIGCKLKEDHDTG